MAGELTWLGHASFRIESPEGKRIYVDPWLGNPKCPDAEKKPERVDLIALTHGHTDHVGETVDLVKQFDCPVVALVELRRWLSEQGLSEDMSQAPNKGGTVEIERIRITLTHAHHSSSGPDGNYLGEPAGLVIELEDGFKLYRTVKHGGQIVRKLRTRSAARGGLISRLLEPVGEYILRPVGLTW